MTGFAVSLAFAAEFVQQAPELRRDDLDPHTPCSSARAYYAREALDASY